MCNRNTITDQKETTIFQLPHSLRIRIKYISLYSANKEETNTVEMP